MDTISLCMIVRDEEPVLIRCLESAAGLYDELVIVDTGSADRTREIGGEEQIDAGGQADYDSRYGGPRWEGSGFFRRPEFCL